MNTLLKINNLTCRYEQHTILKQLSLQIQAGEITCLLGPSGCGKTTLLKAVAGLLPTVSGEITLDKSVVLDQNEKQTKVNIAANKRDDFSRLCIISSFNHI